MKSKIKVGYNCINLTLPYSWKSPTLTNILRNRDFLKNSIEHNMMLLGDIIEFNITNGFKLFRVPTNLLPFLSHIDVSSNYKELDIFNREDIMSEFKTIRGKVRKNDLIISMHPGQYNVLNSQKPEVVKQTLKELEMQSRILELLGGKYLIIHIGGRYNSKEESLKRTIEVTNNYLSDNVKSKLLFENDDKTYNS